MIQASLLMFSRSLTKDYRWIYSDACLTQTDKNLILEDFRGFENNRSFYLGENHLVIRRLKNSLAVYKFSETNITDENSRQIFALTGLVLSGVDLEIVLALSSIILASLFLSTELFIPGNWGIPDNGENTVLPVELSLDQIIDSYKSDKKVKLLSAKINGISHQLGDTAFIMTQERIEPIPQAPRHIQATSQFETSIDEMLNNASTSSTHITISTPALGKHVKDRKPPYIDPLKFFKGKKNNNID